MSKIIINETQLKNLILEASYEVNWGKYPCVTSNKNLTKSTDSKGNIIYVNKKDGSTYYGNGQLAVPGFFGKSYPYSCVDGKITSVGIKGQNTTDNYIKDAELWKKPEYGCVLKQQPLSSLKLNNGAMAFVVNNTRYYSNGLSKTNDSGDGVVGYYKCIGGKPTAIQNPKKNKPTPEITYNGGELKNVVIPPKTKINNKPTSNPLTQKTKQIQKMVGMNNQTGTFGPLTMGKVVSKITGTLSEQESESVEPINFDNFKSLSLNKTPTPELKTNVKIQSPTTTNPIEDLQKLLNTKYNSGLVVDGKYGVRTADAIIKALSAGPINEESITQILNRFRNFK